VSYGHVMFILSEEDEYVGTNGLKVVLLLELL
jgi:hypothetical protein